MATKMFSKTEAIVFGRNMVINNYWFFFRVYLTVLFMAIAPYIMMALFKDPLIYLCVYVSSMILSWLISMGQIKIALSFIDEGRAEYEDLFSCFRLIFKLIGAAFVYGLIVFVGLLLLIVPGIIWAIKYQFYMYLIVDKQLGPIEALKKSAEITKGNKWNLSLFGLLCFLIILLGLICLVIGLAVAVPIAAISYTYVYRKLMPKT